LTRERARRVRLVPESSGEDVRLSTVIGEFDPRRNRDTFVPCGDRDDAVHPVRAAKRIERAFRAAFARR